MSEPREPQKLIKPENWKEFLQEFSDTKQKSSGAFRCFRTDGKVEEEAQELQLEEIVLQSKGERENVEIIRIDRTEGDAEKSKEIDYKRARNCRAV